MARVAQYTNSRSTMDTTYVWSYRKNINKPIKKLDLESNFSDIKRLKKRIGIWLKIGNFLLQKWNVIEPMAIKYR